MKYWNAKAGYPFESFVLEQAVAGQTYGTLGLLGALGTRQIAELYFRVVGTLDAGIFAPQSKRAAVSRLKQLTQQARALQQLGNFVQAESMMKRLLPPVVGLPGV